jgi:addiction module HigA family antidote
MIDRDKLTEEILAEDRVRPPIHPGLVLELEWLEPLGMSVNQLAKAIGVPRQRLNEVVRGKRSISADTALRLARWSGMGARLLARVAGSQRPRDERVEGRRADGKGGQAPDDARITSVAITFRTSP